MPEELKMHDDSVAREQAVIAEYEALNENNIDPADGKRSSRKRS